MYVRVSCASLCNVGPTQEVVLQRAYTAPLADFPGEDSQTRYRRQFIIISRAPGDV
jgi:hypothetical protein